MTQVIFQDKKRSVIAGLEWSVLSHYQAKNSITSEVRMVASDHGADRVIVHAANVDGAVVATVGTTNISELDELTGNEQHALGAVFARSLPDHSNMILAWCDEKTAMIVVVQNGVPVVDLVKPIEEVADFLSKVIDGLFDARGHEIFSNDTGVHRFADLISESDLWAGTSKATRLRKIPYKKAAIAGVMLAVAAVTAGAIYYQEAQKDAKLAATQAALAADDPGPSYEAALGSSLGNLGFDRSSIKLTFQQIELFNVWVEGWLLRQIDCDRKRCTSTWDRKGGTTKALIGALPQQSYLPDESTEEISTFMWTSSLKQAGVESRSGLETEATAKSGSRNVYQVWRNAGVQVSEQTKDFAVWPKPSMGNASLLPRSVSVLARPIEASVRFPFANDLVDSTPAAIWWQSFTFSFTPAGKADQLKITLKGTSYVR